MTPDNPTGPESTTPNLAMARAHWQDIVDRVDVIKVGMTVSGALSDVIRRLKAWLAPTGAGSGDLVDERGSTASPARLENPITCPHCGAKLLESMEEDVCVIFIFCHACHDKIDMKAGDCCVFRSYGQYPCFHPTKS